MSGLYSITVAWRDGAGEHEHRCEVVAASFDDARDAAVVAAGSPFRPGVAGYRVVTGRYNP